SGPWHVAEQPTDRISTCWSWVERPLIPKPGRKSSYDERRKSQGCPSTRSSTPERNGMRPNLGETSSQKRSWTEASSSWGDCDGGSAGSESAACRRHGQSGSGPATRG